MNAWFYCACIVTSNDPVLSFNHPKAISTLATVRIGQNIQYFPRNLACACSCSDRSARNRAVPSKDSPPMVSFTTGVFWTLRTHCRPTFAVPRWTRSPSTTNQLVTSYGLPDLRP